MVKKKDKPGSDALRQLLLAGLIGVAGYIGLQLQTTPKLATAGAWIIGTGSLLAMIWLSVWRLDGPQTKAHVEREDTGRALRDTLLLIASFASLGALILLLVEASQAHGNQKMLLVLAGLGVIAMSWSLVHSLFGLRYARLYYGHAQGGIDFNDKAMPSYKDFAYLAFTVGMTFQVSDTVISSRHIRAAVLRQALLSYVFGTAIIATTINAVASLSAR